MPAPSERPPAPDGARAGGALMGFSDGTGASGAATGTMTDGAATWVRFGIDGNVGARGVRTGAGPATTVGGLAAVSDSASAIGGGADAAASVRSRDNRESTVDTRAVRSQLESAATMSSECAVRRAHTNHGCDIFLSILLW
ncbi:MAG: hypothetical protein ABMA00_06630 [Gemmatimonas sp.]